MEPGNVAEYIDRQKIICAVVLEIKKQRLRLLTETNREVNLSASRLLHKSKTHLNLSMGRDKLVEALKEIANRHKALINQVDIKEIWEIFNTEQEWIDLPTMTEFCFPDSPDFDHESAVVRAFFENRLYFKFNNDRFFPYPKEKVEQIAAQARESERRNQIIKEGGDWLKSVLSENHPSLSLALSRDKLEFVKILKSFYLFEKESKHYALGKAVLARAGINNVEEIFSVLVKLGVWDENENIELYRYEIPTSFSSKVIECATRLVGSPRGIFDDKRRKDLTGLSLMTIDGQSTLDFDDALSIEDNVDHYRLGVHITDVGHFVKKGDLIDQEAFDRASSIYMPDQKVPMLPPILAEDLCSLKSGELRPAISIMARISPSAEIIDYEIISSMIRVKHQLTYYDANMVADQDRQIIILHDIAKKFRKKRLADGAVHISLPEINIWTNEDGEVDVSRSNRESPGRMLVSEIMIMANWLMARFLAKHGLPAIYRSQPGPRERLYKENGGTLFQNWMQRKLLSRFILSHKPERHSGLGLNAYITATSPIRKYFDLISQRQIRAILGFEEPYTSEEIKHMIQLLEQHMSNVSRIQYRRNRYWLLKYLEKRVGQKEEAIVLYKRKNNYLALIPEYMIECDLPLSSGRDLRPEDIVKITIQHVNARKDVLSVFMS